MNKKIIIMLFTIIILIGAVKVYKWMELNDYKISIFDSHKTNSNNQSDYNIGNDGNTNKSSKKQIFDGKEFVKHRYKLLKEKNLKELYSISSWSKGQKSYDVFKSWYDDLEDLNIIGISKLDNGDYKIVVDVYYKGKYKDVVLTKGNGNFYNLKCIPGDGHIGYYKRIVVIKKIINDNGVNKLQTVKVDKEHSLSVPYNFLGKDNSIKWGREVEQPIHDTTNPVFMWVSNYYFDNSSKKYLSKKEIINMFRECSPLGEGGCYTSESWGMYGDHKYIKDYDNGVIVFLYGIYNSPESKDLYMGVHEGYYDKSELDKFIMNGLHLGELRDYNTKYKKRVGYRFNLGVYACNLGYNKLYYKTKFDRHGDEEIHLILADSIIKAINGPTDFVDNIFKPFYKK